jgi:hypothetical protein
MQERKLTLTTCLYIFIAALKQHHASIVPGKDRTDGVNKVSVHNQQTPRKLRERRNVEQHPGLNSCRFYA